MLIWCNQETNDFIKEYRRVFMHIGIYSRKSIYSDKSDSIESQVKICKEYANNYNIETITVYEDEGYTGANTERPGFLKLMEDVTNKTINVLICYKIDRISRNVLDFSNTFNTLQENHIEFVSVKEQIDTSTPLGRAMMYICSVFAQMERETTAERVKDNMIELAKSGKWSGGQAPLGYKLSRVVINEKNHTILSVNEDDIPLLNRIFDTFLSGYTLSGLETHFRKTAVTSTYGNYLSSTQLHQILKNPHYVAAEPAIYDYFASKGCIMATERDKFDGEHGIIVYGRTSGGRKKKHITNSKDKWIVSVGQHKPLMCADKWVSVQERFGRNLIDKTRKHEIGLLKGIVKCKCGYTMRVKHKIDKIYHKVYDDYYCQNRNRRGSEYCDMSMTKVREIDGALISLLYKIKADKSILHEYIKDDYSTISSRNEKDIKSDIAVAEKRIKKLTDALQENNASSAVKYIIKEIENIDMLITSLNYELREVTIIENRHKIQFQNINEIYDEICDYLNNFETIDYGARVRFLQKIIKSCIWDGHKLFVEF